MSATIRPFTPVPALAFVRSTDGRKYLCNTINHRIDVVDDEGRHLFSFGGYGALGGQFNAPSDVAIVSIAPHDSQTDDTAVLAVADRGNNRIQFFELDGTPLTAPGSRTLERRWNTGPARSGWPFFRLAATPRMVAPSRLSWHAPFLEVTLAAGGVVTLHLPSAILPEFSEWIRIADRSRVRRALNHFLQEPNRDEIPSSCLQRMAERLRPASLETLYGRTA